MKLKGHDQLRQSEGRGDSIGDVVVRLVLRVSPIVPVGGRTNDRRTERHIDEFNVMLATCRERQLTLPRFFPLVNARANPFFLY